VVLLSLAVWTVLAGCAATTPGRELRGESGPIVWEVVDVRQRLVDNGVRTRWEYIAIAAAGATERRSARRSWEDTLGPRACC
jgi:hypothetical protein